MDLPFDRVRAHYGRGDEDDGKGDAVFRTAVIRTMVVDLPRGINGERVQRAMPSAILEAEGIACVKPAYRSGRRSTVMPR